jgi:phosphate-selective porin OprO/OprP
MPSNALRQSLILALAGLALAPPALAQDAARLQAIEQQIRSLQGELARLRRDAATREAEARAARDEAAQARAAAEAAQRQAAAAPPPSRLEPETGRLTFPGNRPTFTSADGRFRASLGAQGPYDVGGAIQGDRNPGTPTLNSFGQNLRRGRLFFGFQYDDFLLNVTPDFGGSPDGSPTLYEANLNWTPIRPLTLTVGYYKPYYGLGDSMSSNDFLFLERPSIIEISRNIVAGDSRSSVGGRWAADRYFLAGYLTGDVYGSNNSTIGNTQATTGQTGFVGRVGGRPYTTADTDLHLGFTGSYAFDLRRDANGQTLRLRDRPEWRAGDASTRHIDTGNLPADNASTWGPEFGVRWRNFMLQGEYQQINVEQAQSRGALRPDLTFDGGYVEASWVITGEPRRYSTSSAAFGRPNPARPFDFHGGGWGAWEVMARWSLVDLNDKITRGRPQAATGGVYGGRQEVIGLGLSWYPTSYLRFMLDWNIVNANRLNAAGTQQIGDRFHTIGLRTQFAF